MKHGRWKSCRKLWALVLLLILLYSGCGLYPGRIADEQTDQPGGVEVEDAVEVGPGLYLVNEDLEPGRYRVESGVTYYARLRNLDGSMSRYGTAADAEGIIASGHYQGGPIIIDICSSDFAFESIGPGRWRLVDENYRPYPRTRFGDGHWLVGLDIEPGTYRTRDQVLGWQRVSGFGQEPGDVIEREGLSYGELFVGIESGDLGFQTAGGAIWVKID